MSNFGMQMPGGRQVRGKSVDVYTALAFVAMVSLAVAVGVLVRAGMVIGPEGNPIGVQESGRVVLSDR